MRVKRVIKDLKSLYPKGKIVLNTPENVMEIICELDPISQKKAIAVVDHIRLHYHRKNTEIYKIIRGALKLNTEGRIIIIKEGEEIEIGPGVVHSADGDETWIKVSSDPGWTKEDHVFVE